MTAMIYLIVFSIYVFVVAAICYRKKDKIRIHPLFRSLILREKLVIDIHNTGIWKQNLNITRNTEVRPDIVWKKVSQNELIKAGYFKFVDFLSGWKYIGTKCYVRFWNMKVFDVDEWNENHPNEEDKLNDMRSYNLYDYFKSKVVDRFMRGFSKLSMLSGMDQNKIMLAVIAAAGIGIGIYFILRSNGMI